MIDINDLQELYMISEALQESGQISLKADLEEIIVKLTGGN